jgi:hypothetical protein
MMGILAIFQTDMKMTERYPIDTKKRNGSRLGDSVLDYQ